MAEGNSEGKGSFIRERIKNRPVDRKAFFVRLGMVVGLGVLFGLVSAISYTAGVYHLEKNHYRESAREVVLEKTDRSDTSKDTGTKNETVPTVSNITDIKSLESAYQSLKSVAEKAEKCLLPVRAVTEDRDWFADSFELGSQGEGMVIADNRIELLLLVDSELISDASNIRVTLPDGTVAEATEKEYDSNLGLSVIGVSMEDISDENLKNITPATFSKASPDSLPGKNVIALGAPMGVQGSLAYGIVTSSSGRLSKIDSSPGVLVTDIYGSSSGSGILVDLKGEVVGIISRDEDMTELSNLICAYPVGDIMSSIERMSNGQARALLGIYGTDVTKEAMDLGIPKGAYVTDVDMNSPAMECGIQSGDVVTMMGTNEIESFTQLESAIDSFRPGDEAVITVLRANLNGYSEMTFEVELGSLD